MHQRFSSQALRPGNAQTLLALLALLALCAAGGSAHATVTVYTSQAAFNAATSAPATDSFADLTISGPTPAPLARTAGSYGYTVNVDSGLIFAGGTAGNPFLAPNTSTDTLAIGGFSGGVSAAGGLFFASDINGQYALGDVTVTAFDASGSASRTLVAATTSSFLGFVSTSALLGLSVTAVQPVADFLWPSLDNLVLASAAPVPEPQTWGLLLAGLFFVALCSLSNPKETP